VFIKFTFNNLYLLKYFVNDNYYSTLNLFHLANTPYIKSNFNFWKKFKRSKINRLFIRRWL